MNYRALFFTAISTLALLTSCNKRDTVFTCPDFKYELNSWSTIDYSDTIVFKSEDNHLISFQPINAAKSTNSVPTDYFAVCDQRYSIELLCVQDSIFEYYCPELNTHFAIKFIEIIEKETFNKLILINYALKKVNHFYYDVGIDFQIEPKNTLLKNQTLSDSIRIGDKTFYNAIRYMDPNLEEPSEIKFKSLVVAAGHGLLQFDYQGKSYDRVD